MLFAAFQELIAEKGFDPITVQDIAERSTLNRATFYKHFTDKTDLLGAMMREKFAAAVEARVSAPDATCEMAMRQVILAACDFLAAVPSGCQKHQSQFAPMVESQVKSVIAEFLSSALRAHGARNPDLKATIVSWAVAGAALQWSREKTLSVDELADEVLPIVLPVLENKN